MHRQPTFGSCIANNPHPGPPQGEGALLRRSLKLRRGVGCRGWDVGWPRIKNRAFGSDIANSPPATEPWLLGAAWTPAHATTMAAWPGTRNAGRGMNQGVGCRK